MKNNKWTWDLEDHWDNQDIEKYKNLKNEEINKLLLNFESKRKDNEMEFIDKANELILYSFIKNYKSVKEQKEIMKDYDSFYVNELYNEYIDNDGIDLFNLIRRREEFDKNEKLKTI